MSSPQSSQPAYAPNPSCCPPTATAEPGEETGATEGPGGTEDTTQPDAQDGVAPAVVFEPVPPHRHGMPPALLAAPPPSLPNPALGGGR